jgi:glycosyltransferase involved in cell wall biosynthesis
MIQLLRLQPPGYGGVERVAHEIALELNTPVYSLSRSPSLDDDHFFSIPYERHILKTIKFKKVFLILPLRRFWDLVLTETTIYCHLPSPEVTLIALVARLFNRKRVIIVHWHCFLDGKRWHSQLVASFYNRLSLLILSASVDAIITTSPNQKKSLSGIVKNVPIYVLPCSLSRKQEKIFLGIPAVVRRIDSSRPLSFLILGRLDSYKRIDLAVNSLRQIDFEFKLVIAGDGPLRTTFERLIKKMPRVWQSCKFLGHVTESCKIQLLTDADILLLCSDLSNEGFGIVQLEAMASGRLAMSFKVRNSGMDWVSDIKALQWSKEPDSLTKTLDTLRDPALLNKACMESRTRYLELFSTHTWRPQLYQILKKIKENKAPTS